MLKNREPSGNLKAGQSKSNALIVFVKNAGRGKVKTRLASVLGEESAWNIYRALCERISEICSLFPGPRFVYYSDDIPEEQDLWSEGDFIKKKQFPSPDLGKRMQAAFEEICPDFDSVLLIGSDIPQLTLDIFHEALLALTENDLVFGPALDGGYYLVGMREVHESLFEQMVWSVETVLQESLRRAEERKWSYHLLPPLPDIDTAEDWQKYGWF
jgi:rSAM/selenodomain-associated transferase 1